jgi:hypothetical protein
VHHNPCIFRQPSNPTLDAGANNRIQPRKLCVKPVDLLQLGREA